eukprot:scaffold233675_cov23-Tisochrysis_lutea.AAC.2
MLDFSAATRAPSPCDPRCAPRQRVAEASPLENSAPSLTPPTVPFRLDGSSTWGKICHALGWAALGLTDERLAVSSAARARFSPSVSACRDVTSSERNRSDPSARAPNSPARAGATSDNSSLVRARYSASAAARCASASSERSWSVASTCNLASPTIAMAHFAVSSAVRARCSASTTARCADTSSARSLSASSAREPGSFALAKALAAVASVASARNSASAIACRASAS